MSKLLSLCIPTYGIIEWIFPVLDSIYSQSLGLEDDFEVVVTNNGNNDEFENLILEYCKQHNNLVYKKTFVSGFLNEIESYKLASGDFIKFINHRTCLLDGSLLKLLNFVKDNFEEKPFVYFPNGELKTKKVIQNFSSFDSFVKKLSYWSTWSTGMGFWKDDFAKIPSDVKFNELFPHTTILFSQRNKSKYIIDNSILLKELPADNSKKGKYDLFFAFAVEYPCILLDLCRNGDLSVNSFNSIKKDNLFFLRTLYFDFIFLKKKCSYDLTSFDESISVFYSKWKIKRVVLLLLAKKVINKIIRIFRKK